MNYQTSRRSFISSITILSAGTAFGSVNDFFSPEKSKADLRQQWNSFWKQNGGMLFHESFQPGEKSSIRCCKGHVHETGKVIYFSNEDLLAEPKWIYWGSEKRKPNDVVITFFENSQPKKKIFRINRFELESIHILTADKNLANPVKILRETRNCRAIEIAENSLKIVTRIRKGRDVRIVVTHPKRQIAIENKFIL